MKMKGMKKAVSLLLAAALVVTLFSGQGTMLAAKKSGKTKAKVSSVKITNTGKKLRLQKGKKFRLKTSVKVKPNNSKNKKLKFTSSNRKVVLVNSRGLLKGLRVGTAKITAASKINSKKKATISVSVTKDVLVTNIKLNKTKITADEFNENEIPLKVTKILPSNAKNKKVVWSTDDESVADVDDSGVVTTGDVGTATITATAADQGGAYATCRVTVVENSDRGDDVDVTEQPADAAQKPPVQEEPGEITPSAGVPTQEPGQGEVSPSPEEPEKTASPAPGKVTAAPETDAPGKVTAEPETDAPSPEETVSPAPGNVTAQPETDAPGEVTAEPTGTTKPAWTPDPNKKVENVTLTYDYEFPGARMVRFDGTVVNHDDEDDAEMYENANVQGYPEGGIDVRYYDKVIAKYEGNELTGDESWYGKATLNSTDDELGQNEYSDGLFLHYLQEMANRGKYVDGVYTVEYDINEETLLDDFVFEDVGLIDSISVQLANDDDYAGFKLKSIEFIANSGTPAPKPTTPVEWSGELNAPRMNDDGTTTWDCVYFGNYWQNDTNGDGKADKDDRKQPIKWRVLSVDGDDAFLLADKNIDAQSYNDTYTDVTWETCTMRSWLNGYGAKMNQSGKDYSGGGFIDHAFSADERSAIKTVSVVNNDNPEYGTEGGNDTSDKVYLLSIEEATNPAYGFSSNCNKYDIGRRTKNTEYTMWKGAYTNTSNGYVGNGGWWLRSPGDSNINAAGVHDYGYVFQFGYGINTPDIPVRPALHLNLSSASNWTYAGTVSSEDRKPVTKPEGTPDPFVPEGEGWQKLDLSRWSGNSDNYSEEGNLVLLDGVEFETVPLPEILENIGDKMEIIVRGSVSEDSCGFRFWMTNAGHYTMSQQYHYTEQYGVGLREADMELDVDGTAGEFHPGESFQLQTVLENVNWDGNEDPVCTNLMLKGPAYGEYMEDITITGIWVRYGDAIGTTPDVSPTPAGGTPTPLPSVPGVETEVVEYELSDPMINDDGTTTWDCVYFGNYWQNDTNGDGIADTDDEKQPIKWRVLSVSGDDAFLVADENLDSQPYNDELMEVTWETSTLRSWLNDDFFTQAFTAGEQSAIWTTKVVNDDNPYHGSEGGDDTLDRVYLLSIDEMRKPEYGFSTAEGRRADNTQYMTEYIGNDGNWWLRSSGYSNYTAAYVNDYGYVTRHGCYVIYDDKAVRPALHLNLASVSSWSYAGTVTVEGRAPESPQKPTPTPDPWTPSSQDVGWIKLDLSSWSGGESNFLETGDQFILDDTEFERLPLPTLLENVGDKVEVLIRGSVSKDSEGFRFWMVNERNETRSGQYYYTLEDGEMYKYGESCSDYEEKQIGEYKPGEFFHIQTVLENINWDNNTDSVCTKLLLKAPAPGMNIAGVTITGIWVRYGDKIGTTVEDPTIKVPDIDTPAVEIPKVESYTIDFEKDYKIYDEFDLVPTVDNGVLTAELPEEDFVGFHYILPDTPQMNAAEFKYVTITYTNTENDLALYFFDGDTNLADPDISRESPNKHELVVQGKEHMGLPKAEQETTVTVSVTDAFDNYDFSNSSFRGFQIFNWAKPSTLTIKSVVFSKTAP